MVADTVRSFLAVEVAPEIQIALVDLKRALAACGAAVRWVRDENLHATVKFLGPVPALQLPEVRRALDAALATTPPLPARVGGLGIFPTAKRPRVIWVGVDCPGLADVAALVDAALAPLGFAPETRAFAAHMTLGRVKDRRGWARLEPALGAHWNDDLGACGVDEVAAFRSDLRRDGAVYTKLWTIPFGG